MVMVANIAVEKDDLESLFPRSSPPAVSSTLAGGQTPQGQSLNLGARRAGLLAPLNLRRFHGFRNPFHSRCQGRFLGGFVPSLDPGTRMSIC